MPAVPFPKIDDLIPHERLIPTHEHFEEALKWRRGDRARRRASKRNGNTESHSEISNIPSGYVGSHLGTAPGAPKELQFSSYLIYCEYIRIVFPFRDFPQVSAR